MSYSITGIVNLGLTRIGGNLITDITNTSQPNAIKANAIWEYIRDEVLEARDWKFAKIRKALTKNVTAPLYGYSFAYALPADFLRLVKSKYSSSKGINPVSYASGSSSGLLLNLDFDPPVWPPGYPWIIEALPDGTKCLFSDYDNADYLIDADYNLYINYIQKVTDATKYTPAFINALAWRIGKELSIAIAESINKFKFCDAEYERAIRVAEANNEALDFLEDETGSTSWESAGR